MALTQYPPADDPELVGTFDALAKAGGGYVWDKVLEYRVWCHPYDGADDLFNGDDYFYAFENYQTALEFSEKHAGVGKPLALILQEEYIDEPEPNVFIHKEERRITEWLPEFLSRPRRTKETIPRFFAADPKSDRLDVIRGLVKDA